MINQNTDKNIGIIGLGYVGLPLAIEFGKINTTIGFDINKSRIDELRKSIDSTLEIESKEFDNAKLLTFTNNKEDLQDIDIYIITVPTPLDDNTQPDLGSLKKACETIAPFLSDQNIVIFESTVYPGATEEYCVPILEGESGLSFINSENEDQVSEGFYCGYSPERINPGDKERTLTDIKKVTSASTLDSLEIVDNLYNTIIKAGTVKASSIKIAEAAKVIENTQRDVNIALINEFSLIFKRLSIDTEEILEVASTKWNFIHLKPGLVGGHCIGVDPYYLAHKAISSGYYPKLILSGRETNNKMGKVVADEVMTIMARKNISILNSKVLLLGFTFKENCPDVRNTKVIDIIDHLEDYGCNVDVYDPMINLEDIQDEYEINLISEPKENTYDAAILAVSHQDFIDMGINKISNLLKENNVIYDVKYLFDINEVDGRL